MKLNFILNNFVLLFILTDWMRKNMSIFNFFKKPLKDDVFTKHPDGMLIVSIEGRIIDANQKAIEMFNCTRYNIVGEFFSSFIDGGSNLLNKIVNTKLPQISKALIQGQQEDSFFEISASRDEEEQKVYVSLRDTTQSYKVQNMVSGQYEIAKNIIDEKNTYLVNISNEILSQLETIESFSKALMDGIGGVLVDKQLKYINIINKNSSELISDLDKLFSIFRLESNLYQYDFRNFDFVNILNNIVKEYETIFAHKKILFEHNFSSLVSRNCHLDSEVLEMIVKSVLEVFSKNTQAGKITFNVGNPPVAFLEGHDFEGKISQEPSHYALFEMKASELFLEDDELHTIFETYNYNAKNRRPVGMQLSFALIKRFAKYLKGDVWVYSKPTFGTMVAFVLPLEKK